MRFYRYTPAGFMPEPEPAEFAMEDGDDWDGVLTGAGWHREGQYGDTDDIAFTTYRHSDGAERGTFVELWDHSGEIWSAVVPDILWPKFFRQEILPIVQAVSTTKISGHIERLANAVIAIGRHGTGREIDRFDGQSITDKINDRRKYGR